MSKHFGKYRGKVENNIDPMLCGRIQVSVPMPPQAQAGRG